MANRTTNSPRKTMIGVLASHDDVDRNNSLVSLFERLKKDDPDKLNKFRFVFTGGTYDRLFRGTSGGQGQPLKTATRDFLLQQCGVLRLPSRLQGGVTVLAYLVVQRKISILWPFLTPMTAHWLNPENLALLRLCDQWHTKKLMNTGSVEEWFTKEARLDTRRNLQDWPPELTLDGTKSKISLVHSGKLFEVNSAERVESTKFSASSRNSTIALIAHDQMKDRMAEFASDYERELARFHRILTTGTTGKVVEEAAPSLKSRIHRYHSGPKGGDIEIATEILYGCCQAVVFFVDPLHPHPHIEDIRVVFGACMIQDRVRMLSNEMQAREWMERVVRRQSR
jgi:methylglyoxal synthase